MLPKTAESETTRFQTQKFLKPTFSCKASAARGGTGAKFKSQDGCLMWHIAFDDDLGLPNWISHYNTTSTWIYFCWWFFTDSTIGLISMKKHQLGEDVWNFFQAFPSKSKLMCVYFVFFLSGLLDTFFEGGMGCTKNHPRRSHLGFAMNVPF